MSSVQNQSPQINALRAEMRRKQEQLTDAELHRDLFHADCCRLLAWLEYYRQALRYHNSLELEQRLTQQGRAMVEAIQNEAFGLDYFTEMLQAYTQDVQPAELE